MTFELVKSWVSETARLRLKIMGNTLVNLNRGSLMMWEKPIVLENSE